MTKSPSRLRIDTGHLQWPELLFQRKSGASANISITTDAVTDTTITMFGSIDSVAAEVS